VRSRVRSPSRNCPTTWLAGGVEARIATARVGNDRKDGQRLDQGNGQTRSLEDRSVCLRSLAQLFNQRLARRHSAQNGRPGQRRGRLVLEHEPVAVGRPFSRELRVRGRLLDETAALARRLLAERRQQRCNGL